MPLEKRQVRYRFISLKKRTNLRLKGKNMTKQVFAAQKDDCIGALCAGMFL